MTRLAAVLALLCSTGLLAACGSDSSSSDSQKPAASSSGGGSGGGQQLKLTAAEPGPGKYAFKPGSLKAKAGAATITMENPTSDKIPHSIAIEGNGIDEEGKVVPPGQSSTVSVTLKAGTYTFYCTVGDHRQQGMEGKLTVS